MNWFCKKRLLPFRMTYLCTKGHVRRIVNALRIAMDQQDFLAGDLGDMRLAEQRQTRFGGGSMTNG